MKGFITAIIIFTSLSISLFFYNLYITDTFATFSDSISLIEDEISKENYVQAKEVAVFLEKKLNDDAHILYFITDRTPIDNALTECSKLICFIEVNDKAEAYASAAGIRIILDKTKEKSLLKSL